MIRMLTHAHACTHIRTHADICLQVIGLYFSAHWCGPCREFTPFLCDWLARFRADHPLGNAFEVVFVSRDHSRPEFDRYRKEMNFPALPFELAQGAGSDLGELYGVTSIPSLVIVQSDGEVITTDGRLTLSTDYDPPGACK
jgi:nucleoredoxin